MKTRVLSLLLAALMLISVGASASGINKTGLPITNEKTTFTVMLRKDEADGRWEDLEIMKWLEEQTNVHFEYDVYTSDDMFKEQLGLQLMSGSYSDVLMPRGPMNVPWYKDEEYGREGFVIDLKPLIDEWMPNAKAFFEEYPASKAGSTAGNGAIYGLPYYYQMGVGGNPHLWYMETYWIKAAGWDDVPNTVYEMDQFVRDIKALLDSGDYMRPEDDMYVLGITNPYGNVPQAHLMLTGFTGTLISVENVWAVPDNKTVEFMVNHPGYREALEMMAAWYRDGIINPDVFTMDGATYNANKTANKYAMFTGSSSALDPNLIRDRVVAEAEGRTYYGCTAIRPLTSEYNPTPRVAYESFGNINQLMITDKCKNPEIIARWADLFFNMDYDVTDNSVPNPMMFYKGFYGTHWEYTNPERTEWTFLDRPDGKANDDGTSKITWDYSRAYLVPGWSIPSGGILLDNAFAAGSPMYIAKQITNVENEYPYVTTDTQFPPLARWSQEETDAAATKLADLQRYLQESWGQFMSGEREINDANWNAFLAECQRIGSDEITAIYQQVFDRWNAALE
ncbi:hypothetical protein AGMMS49992_13240 [Clostridia bacterium]|nr:hypothetical protein AGMMS49992_13240 [Clostridia bacterium]